MCLSALLRGGPATAAVLRAPQRTAPTGCGMPSARASLLAAVLMAAGAAAQHLAVRLDEAALDLTAHGIGDRAEVATLRVAVADKATGASIGAAQVVLSTLTYMPASEQESVVQTASGAVLSPEQAGSDAASTYSVDFMSLFAGQKPAVGLYRLDLLITAPYDGSAAAPATVSLTAKVNAAIEPVDFKITTTKLDGAKKEVLEFSAQHPAAVPGTVDLKTATEMTVGLRVRSVHDGSYVQPHQAMVYLTSDHGQKRRVVAVATPQEDDPDRLEAKLNVRQSSRTLATHSGEYTMQIVVGDFFANNAIVWDVATVSLRGTNATGIALGASPAKPQPVIKHRFRDPEATSVPVLSGAFAAATAAPSLFLVLVLMHAGANLGGCSRMSAGKVAAVVGFHACTAAMLCLSVAFWVSGTLGDTAEKLVPLAATSLLLGWVALREEGGERAPEEQKAKKAE